MPVTRERCGAIVSTNSITAGKPYMKGSIYDISRSKLERDIENDEITSRKLRLYTLIIGLITISGLVILSV